jgi:hypothetical protein
MVTAHFYKRFKTGLSCSIILSLFVVVVSTLEFGASVTNQLTSSTTTTINDTYANLNITLISTDSLYNKRLGIRVIGKKESPSRNPFKDSRICCATIRDCLLSQHFPDFNTVFYIPSALVSLLLDLPPPSSSC